MKSSKLSPTTRPRAERRRSAGRPEAHETVGREKLIEALIVLLRRKEPSAISIQEVATTAGVDRALVRYYFGDKHGMLVAAASHIVMALQDHAAKTLRGTGSAAVRLRRRIETLIGVMSINPRFHQLLLDHVYKSKDGVGRALLETIGKQGLSLTADFLHNGETSGELRRVDPRFLHLAIIGLCEFFVASGPLQDVLFRDDVERGMRQQRYAEFVCDLLLNGLLPRAG
jgi:AcrR family transcriptional regulator